MIFSYLPAVIIVFLLGAIIGSFLNVVILRWNTGQSIFGASERSRCFSCRKQLVWWELLPIVSFFMLRGRCSSCKSKISWQYPAVEALTGVSFALLFFKFPAAPVIFIFYAVIASLLIVIVCYDLKHKIIPNFFVYAFVLLALARVLAQLFFAAGFFAVPPLAAVLSLDVLAGPIFYAAFALLWLVSGGRWLGFGDAKLVLGIGLLLGLSQGLSALVLAFWIGAAVSLFIMFVPLRRLPLLSQHLTMKSEIPFAPFLILGTALAFFCSIDIFGLANFF